MACVPGSVEPLKVARSRVTSQLSAAVCSITRTQRRRFLWAAWWSAEPVRAPFRKPDASSGGARTREEALRAAEQAAGRVLREIDGSWARAWLRVLAGQPAWSLKGGVTQDDEASPPRPEARLRPGPASIWQVLGVPAGASLSEVKQAYRKRALETHPDRGGDADTFRAVHAAYEEALKRAGRRARSARASRPTR
jgi:hypothetical protein